MVAKDREAYDSEVSSKKTAGHRLLKKKAMEGLEDRYPGIPARPACLEAFFLPLPFFRTCSCSTLFSALPGGLTAKASLDRLCLAKVYGTREGASLGIWPQIGTAPGGGHSKASSLASSTWLTPTLPRSRQAAVLKSPAMKAFLSWPSWLLCNVAPLRCRVAQMRRDGCVRARSLLRRQPEL